METFAALKTRPDQHRTRTSLSVLEELAENSGSWIIAETAGSRRELTHWCENSTLQKPQRTTRRASAKLWLSSVKLFLGWREWCLEGGSCLSAGCARLTRLTCVRFTVHFVCVTETAIFLAWTLECCGGAPNLAVCTLAEPQMFLCGYLGTCAVSCNFRLWVSVQRFLYAAVLRSVPVCPRTSCGSAAGPGWIYPWQVLAGVRPVLFFFL